MKNFNCGLSLGVFSILICAISITFGCQKNSSLGEAILLSSLPEKGNLISLFKSMDPSILKSSDETFVKGYIDKRADLINAYITKYYGQNLMKESDNNAGAVVLAGLVVATHEIGGSASNLKSTNSFQVAPNKAGETPQWVHCGVAALTGYEGIEKLFSGTASLMTATKALTIIKSVLTRYLGYVGVAIAIYEFGECMGWYN